jgi:hypothetical protein
VSRRRWPIQPLTPREPRGYSSGIAAPGRRSIHFSFIYPLSLTFSSLLSSLSGRFAPESDIRMVSGTNALADLANKCVLRPRGRTWELEKRMLAPRCICDYKVSCFLPNVTFI